MKIILVADPAVTPVIPTTLSLVVLKQLLKIFGKVGAEEKRINAFFSMVDPRKLKHKDVVEKFQHYPIFPHTQIPFQAEIEKMVLYRQPVGAVSSTSVVAQCYQELWKELWDRSELV